MPLRESPPSGPPGSDDEQASAPDTSDGADPDGRGAAAFPIVGIGASAGGLEAFGALLSALPTDTGMAFVVIPHLDPKHPSALPDILGRATRMPVVEVTDRQTVEPNGVYVLPPGHDMTIDDGRLLLHRRATGTLHRPVDLFFRSLAQDRRHQAIGVILSGTATDGTLGTRAIKSASGITFAQDESARQPGMPHSAIADGFVDFVLPPAGIAEELVRISRLPRGNGDSAAALADDSVHLADILQSVRRETAVNFTHYRSGTLRRRILRRMILTKTDALEDYARLLHRDSGEARALHDDLLIGVTSFFRDPESFEALAQKAFAQLLTPARANDPIRVWVLGCSTGEEAYSLAMCLTEFIEQQRLQATLQIFASDVNPAGIETARAGIYPADIVQDVSPERLRRFFVEVEGHYRICKAIRDVCIFSRHNVLTDPPFSRISLVSCRNLLMYLEPVLQHDVVRDLHYALMPEGILWLGRADATGANDDLFDVVDAQHKVFQRRSGTVSHPALQALPSRWHLPMPTSSRTARGDVADLLKESDRVVLSRFAPAAMLVSPGMEVLQYRGDVGPYIAPASGKASLGLMQVLDRALQGPVRAAIAKAERENTNVREEGIHVSSGHGERRTLSIEVVRVGPSPSSYLVLFDERPRQLEPADHAAAGHGSGASEAEDELARVSKELADTRAHLQSLVEDQESAREDLESAHEQAQSANEELQSINEELETSKEEIQSANEELTTLNEELQHRNTELQTTNSDLENLLASTHLSVLFLGLDLCIRRFTPAAGRLLRLRSADIGRPLRELRMDFDVDFDGQITRTIETLETTELNVQGKDGRWMSVRIRPYRTVDNQIGGAVVVFVDIDAIVRARVYAESIIATVRAPLVVLDEQFSVVTANEAFYRMLRRTARDTEGRSFFEIEDRRWDRPELRTQLAQVLPQNRAVTDVLVRANGGGGQPEVLMLNATRLVHPELGRYLMLLSLEDVTERQQADSLRQQRVVELAAADQSKNEFLAMLAHELRNPLAPIRTAAQLLGATGVPANVSENARVIIERQIQNMTRLIDDLLNVARITQGKIDLRLAPLDLVPLLRRAVEAVQPHVDECEQQLTVSLPAEPIYVLGDATRLEQAFGNLLGNASKFTHRRGHIWFTAQLKRTLKGNDVFVHVRDDGIGIPADTLPHVFEVFKQGKMSPHRTPGLGVGLALVDRIVELHGGKVTARSAGQDDGSEFTVCLPLLHDASLADAPPRVPEPAAPMASRRILVVDDSVDAAESLRNLLRVWGHEVQMVHDGPAALEAAAAFVPSIIFLDIGMPGMDGYEVARRLRRIPALEGISLIALTGFGSEQDRRRARAEGFDQHVTKPVDQAALRMVLSHEPDATNTTDS